MTTGGQVERDGGAGLDWRDGTGSGLSCHQASRRNSGRHEQHDRDDGSGHDAVLHLPVVEESGGRTRAKGHSVTAFEVVWPQVARRLNGFLARRGTPASEVEDVIQEVALRVVSSRVPFTDADDLLPWCLVTARNVDIGRRRYTTRVVVGDCPEQRTPSLEETVDARLRLEATLDALVRLSSADRQILVEALEGQDRGAASAVRVARHRARRRLAKALGSAIAAVVAIRRVLRPEHSTVAPAASGVAVALVTVASVVTLSLGPDLGSSRTETSVSVNAGHQARGEPKPGSRAPMVNEPTDLPHQPAISDRSHPAPVAPRSANQEQLSIQSPDRHHTATVTNHPRRPQDDGLICVDDAPLVAHKCLGPGDLPPIG